MSLIILHFIYSFGYLQPAKKYNWLYTAKINFFNFTLSSQIVISVSLHQCHQFCSQYHGHHLPT
jgi:hypothetical protein